MVQSWHFYPIKKKKVKFRSFFCLKFFILFNFSASLITKKIHKNDQNLFIFIFNGVEFSFFLSFFILSVFLFLLGFLIEGLMMFMWYLIPVVACPESMRAFNERFRLVKCLNRDCNICSLAPPEQECLLNKTWWLCMANYPKNAYLTEFPIKICPFYGNGSRLPSDGAKGD